jgi:hypothetical protein
VKLIIVQHIYFFIITTINQFLREANYCATYLKINWLHREANYCVTSLKNYFYNNQIHREVT